MCFHDSLELNMVLTRDEQAYTKGAIYRQMQEYSRKAQTAESRLEELHKRSVHHDDHLRIVDAWWRQILEELELLAEQTVKPDSTAAGTFSLLSSVITGRVRG
jgi:E3 ubiquitin-protein ligase BRE1